MFSDLLELSVLKKRTHKNWTIVLSGIAQAVSLGMLLLVPLIYTQALPKGLLNTFLFAPQPKAPSPPPSNPTRIAHTGHRIVDTGLKAPQFIPPNVLILTTPELPPDVVGNRQQDEIFRNILGLASNDRNPSLKGNGPPVPKPAVPDRIKQGGKVQQALLIRQQTPLYPPLAVQAHIEGNVVLRAIIDKEGKVSELQVISGPPLLVKAALDAVRQWRYKPTTLNGYPVEVETTITVTFTLGG
jgi:protein TonB